MIELLAYLARQQALRTSVITVSFNEQTGNYTVINGCKDTSEQWIDSDLGKCLSSLVDHVIQKKTEAANKLSAAAIEGEELLAKAAKGEP